MPIGPGKYDELASAAFAAAQAQSVILIVVGGNKGSGFCVQSKQLNFDRLIPDLLRQMADAIEGDFNAMAQN